MKTKKFFLLCIVACHFSPRGNAQTLPLVNYTIQNGLPEAKVYAVYEDVAGYLWIGTQGGVAAFDGRQFHTYDAQAGLPDNHVTAITGDQHGRTYFGHLSGALSFYQKGIINTVKFPGFQNNRQITSMLWQSRSLYIATQGNGLYAITQTNNKWEVKHFTVGQQLPSDTIRELATKDSNEIWMATSRGLVLFNTGTNRPVVSDFPIELHQNITAVFQPANLAANPRANAPVSLAPPGHPITAGVWCGTVSGAIYFDPEHPKAGLRKITRADGLINEQINKIQADAKGNIWLATNRGIAKVKGKTVCCYTKGNGLLSEVANAIIMDREHNIWIGQEDGISCYKDLPFELYTKEDGLIYNEVYSIMQDSRNNYWIATAQGITVFYRQISSASRRKNFTVKDGIPDNLVYKVFEDSRRNIWVACVNKGAACYFPKEDRFTVFNSSNGLAGKRVVSINEDLQGRVWLATLDGGVAVYSYTSKKMHSYWEGHGFVSNAVWTIYRDARGRLWFGSQDKGLVYQDPTTGNFKVVPGQEKLPNHNFGSISSDQAGNIWIASIGAGIFRYDGHRFQQYGIREGIKSNNPYFIFCDKNDQIWLGTNTGLDLFNPNSLKTRSFGKNEGFIGIETNQNAIYQSRNNDLWIGTVNGLMHYQFKVDSSVIPAPLVYITKKHLLFDENDLKLCRLTYQQNDLTFDFLAISLGHADKIRYSYCLDGFDRKWSPLALESRVSYANLPPGKYNFKVKAGYVSGLWSKPATYQFVIAPPFFKTWWFILLLFVAVYSLIYMIYRYRVNQILKLERMRNKIASDLHDDIGSALSSISIFSEVADKQLEQQTAPGLIREVIGRISDQSRVMLEAMDDIVWAVNPKNDHFDDLAVRMREFAIPLMEAKGIHFDFDVDFDAQLQNMRLSMETRKCIFLIFKECIHNIMKHSGCSRIQVSVRKVNKQLGIFISDNGCGFDTGQQTNRNGLINMQKRATTMNAVLQISSVIGTGTSVTLLVNII